MKGDLIQLSVRTLFLLYLFCSVNFNALGVGNDEVDAANINAALAFNRDNVGRYNNFMRYDSEEFERLYVSMKANETFYFGFNFQLRSNGDYSDLEDRVWVRIKDADGNIVFPATEIVAGQPGYINTRAEASVGPQPLGGAGGYSPLSFVPTVSGDYYLEIAYDDGNANNGAGNGVRDEPVGRGNVLVAPLYDFTVGDNATNLEVTGRVWSKAWHIIIKDQWNADTEGTFQYIYTDDGVISELDYNGMNPYEYVIAANSTGVYNTGDVVEDRKSIYSRLGDGILPQYKLFYEVPDTSVFKVSSINDLFGNLNSSLTITGCSDYTINFSVTKAMESKIVIERNGVPGYQSNSTDVLIETLLEEGENKIPWDGRDGLGNIISEAILDIDLSFRSGVTHLPMFDVEYNENGFKVNYVFPTELAGPAGVYWDDSELRRNQINIDNPCISSGTSGCHIWGNRSRGDDFGDETIINTWWYLETEPLQVSYPFTLPYLSITNDTTVCTGEFVDLKASTNGYLRWTEQGVLISNDSIISVQADVERTYVAESFFVDSNLFVNSAFEESPPNSGFSSQYGDTTETHLTSGRYVITDNPNKGWGTPHLDIGDHTSGTGNMMVIDGTREGGIDTLYKQTVEVLSGKSYVFSFWGINVHTLDPNRNPAELELVVNNTSLGTYDLLEMQWRIKFAFWRSPFTGPVEVAIINRQINGLGNDFAIDDVEFGTIGDCELQDSVTVTPVDGTDNDVEINISPQDTSFCSESPVTYRLITASNLGTSPTYQWYVNGVIQAGETFDQFTYRSTKPSDTISLIAMSSIQNCITKASDTATAIVTNFAPANLLLDPIPSVCSGDTLQLKLNADKALTSINWSGDITTISSTTIDNPKAYPNEDTQYKVVVEDIDGCIDSMYASLFIKQIPDLSLKPDTSICPHQEVQLSVTSTNKTLKTVLWEYNESTIDDVLSLTPVVKPAATSWYKVTGTDTDDCINTDSIEVVVTPFPVVDAGEDKKLCRGDSINLLATGATSYSWSPSTFLNATDIANPQTKPTDTITYIVTGVTNGCALNDTVFIGLTELINLTIEPIPSLCVGDTTQLVINTPKTLSTIAWTGDIGSLSSTSIENPLAFPTVTANYKVNVVDIDGCRDSLEASVTPKLLPTVLAEKDTTICGGETVQLVGSSDKSVQSILWQNKESTLSSTTTLSPLATPTETTTYRLTITDLDNCKNEDDVTVTVNPYPVVDAGADTKICTGETASLLATGADDYLWNPSSSLNFDNIANPEASPVDTTEYIVTGTTNGCSANDTVIVNVLDNPIPQVTIQYDKDICEGEVVRFDIVAQENLGSSPTYQWYRTSGATKLPISQKEFALDSTFVTGDAFSLEVVSNEICVTPLNQTASSNMLYPKVFPYPDLEITGITRVCYGENIMVFVQDRKGLVTNYSWVDNQNKVLFESSNSSEEFINIIEDKYVKVIGSSNNCADTSNTLLLQPIIVSLNIEVKDSIIFGDQTTELYIASNAATVQILTKPDFMTSTYSGAEIVTVKPAITTDYLAYAENEGCSATDSVRIRVLPPVSAPYLFSPNDDGKNDLWIVKDLDKYPYTRVTILNRWGTEVAKLEQGKNTWDGSNQFGGKLPDGVYYYVIEASIEDFEDGGNKLIQFSGYVTLAK